MKPYLSFVVLTHNNWTLTRQAIWTLVDSLNDSITREGVEILIVDNGSTDETVAEASEIIAKQNFQDVKVRLVRLEHNMGYPVGINMGLMHTRGDIIGVLNNDLEFPPGWLDPLLEVLEQDKTVGFVAPYLSFAYSIQNVNVSFANSDEMIQFAESFMAESKGKVTYVNRLIGACLLFRRDVLTTIGGNDYWYGIGNYDDDDWCLRANVAGYKVALVGGSFVYHVGHGSFRSGPQQYNDSLASNGKKFETKWNIAERHNPTGQYSRVGVVTHTRFQRAFHFIPTSLTEYSQSKIPILPRTRSGRRTLLICDWTNSQSDWKAELQNLLTEGRDQDEVCLWVPQSHFNLEDMAKEVQQVIARCYNQNQLSVNLFTDEVPAVDLFRILRSADMIAEVPNDFVNRFIVYLAQKISLPVSRASSPNVERHENQITS